MNRCKFWAVALTVILFVPRAAVTADPVIESLEKMAKESYYHGDYNKAIAEFTKDIKHDPKYAAAYSRRGIAYWHKGEHDKAIADFSEAVRLDPKNAKAFILRGRAYLDNGDPDNCYDYYYCRGRAYGPKGEPDKAIADFSEAIRLDQANTEAYYNRGWVYGAKGDLDSAITDYDKAIQFDKYLANAYYGRGLACQKKGDKSKAEADFRQADKSLTVLAEAVLLWTGKGRLSSPARDDSLVVKHYGADAGNRLLSAMKYLDEEFYLSDAYKTCPDLVEMGKKAAQDFKKKHPELPDDIAKTLEWCYTWDYFW